MNIVSISWNKGYKNFSYNLREWQIDKLILRYCNSIFYFCIQEDDNIGIFSNKILKYFNKDLYHIIVNTSSDSIGLLRQIILIPTIYKIESIDRQEVSIKNAGLFPKAILLTSFNIVEKKTRKLLFTGVNFPKPLRDQLKSDYCGTMIDKMKEIDPDIIILSGDFNFYNYENSKIYTKLNTYVDINYDLILKHFYEPISIKKTNTNSDLMLDHIFYWLKNNPYDVKLHSVLGTSNGSNHKPIISVLFYNDVLIYSGSDKVKNMYIGINILDIFKSNKKICFIIIVIILLIIFMIYIYFNHIRTNITLS